MSIAQTIFWEWEYNFDVTSPCRVRERKREPRSRFPPPPWREEEIGGPTWTRRRLVSPPPLRSPPPRSTTPFHRRPSRHRRRFREKRSPAYLPSRRTCYATASVVYCPEPSPRSPPPWRTRDRRHEDCWFAAWLTAARRWRPGHQDGRPPIRRCDRLVTPPPAWFSTQSRRHWIPA